MAIDLRAALSGPYIDPREYGADSDDYDPAGDDEYGRGTDD